MSDAYVALLLIHLHFPEAGSLKAKRRELQSVKAQLRGRLGVDIAEVDHHDRWQRSTLAGALCAGSTALLEERVDAAEDWLLGRFPEGVRIERALASWEDLGGLG